MIDTMSSRDVGTQSSQLISLQSEIATFSPRILIYTVLPTISKLCLQNNTLWVYALPLFSLVRLNTIRLNDINIYLILLSFLIINIYSI